MKRYAFRLNPRKIAYDNSIRNKIDIIICIIEIVRYLTIQGKSELISLEKINLNENNDDKIFLVIYIDKMSRAFIAQKDKIHSFQFPFLIQENNEGFNILFNTIKLNSVICSILSKIFERLQESESIEVLMEKYWETMEDVKDTEEYEQYNYICEKLITYLLTFEAGYIRYDHDEFNVKLNHPEDHLDINYSGSATFKIGSSKMNIQNLIGILDLNSDCKYIEIMKNH